MPAPAATPYFWPIRSHSEPPARPRRRQRARASGRRNVPRRRPASASAYWARPPGPEWGPDLPRAPPATHPPLPPLPAPWWDQPMLTFPVAAAGAPAPWAAAPPPAAPPLPVFGTELGVGFFAHDGRPIFRSVRRRRATPDANSTPNFATTVASPPPPRPPPPPASPGQRAAPSPGRRAADLSGRLGLRTFARLEDAIEAQLADRLRWRGTSPQATMASALEGTTLASAAAAASPAFLNATARTDQAWPPSPFRHVVPRSPGTKAHSKRLPHHTHDLLKARISRLRERCQACWETVSKSKRPSTCPPSRRPARGHPATTKKSRVRAQRRCTSAPVSRLLFRPFYSPPMEPLDWGPLSWEWPPGLHRGPRCPHRRQPRRCRHCVACWERAATRSRSRSKSRSRRPQQPPLWSPSRRTGLTRQRSSKPSPRKSPPRWLDGSLSRRSRSLRPAESPTAKSNGLRRVKGVRSTRTLTQEELRSIQGQGWLGRRYRAVPRQPSAAPSPRSPAPWRSPGTPTPRALRSPRLLRQATGASVGTPPAPRPGYGFFGRFAPAEGDGALPSGLTSLLERIPTAIPAKFRGSFSSQPGGLQRDTAPVHISTAPDGRRRRSVPGGVADLSAIPTAPPADWARLLGQALAPAPAPILAPVLAPARAPLRPSTPPPPVQPLSSSDSSSPPAPAPAPAAEPALFEPTGLPPATAAAEYAATPLPLPMVVPGQSHRRRESGPPVPAPPPGSQLHVIKGHTDYVTAVTVSSDGKYIVSGSRDTTARVWSCLTGEQLAVLQGHEHMVTGVAISRNSTLVVTGSRDKSVRLWDLGTGREVLALHGHTHYVSCVAITPDSAFVLSGSYDETIRLWSSRTGELRATLQGHTDYVRSLAVSGDGAFLASGSNDCTVRLWRLSTGQLAHVLQGHSDYVTCVAISRGGGHIVSGSEDKTIRVWDRQTGELLAVLEGHAGDVSCVAIAPSGAYVVSGSFDRTLRIWSPFSGEVLGVAKGHTGDVTSVAVCPDSLSFVSGSHDKTVRIWRGASSVP